MGILTAATATLTLATATAASSPPDDDSTPPTTTAAPAPTTTPPTTAAPTTTLPAPPPEVGNPECVWVVRSGDSISLIADHLPADVTTGGILLENGIAEDAIVRPDQLLDVCVGNGVDDLTGASRLRPPTVLLAQHSPVAIQRQQEKLNQLFADRGIDALSVDGVSGELTRQQLCAARVFLGLPVSRSDMSANGTEMEQLMALDTLPVPPRAPDADRWGLLDITCQVLIVGERDRVVFVFPTSTGTEGFETREVNASRVFRFDPAIDNGGWHDSSEFPSSYDNPLNGNMYKPIYFSNGQAIHGANNVPPRPASKGCARLRVNHHDLLVAWLGLDTATGPVWRESTINFTVTTQGQYIPDP